MAIFVTNDYCGGYWEDQATIGSAAGKHPMRTAMTALDLVMPAPSDPWYGPAPNAGREESRRVGDAETAMRAADRRRGAMMAAAQAGDAAAYRMLLRECVGLVRTLAGQKGVAPGRVDDVVQETLLSVHRALRTYDPRRSFTAWLTAIAQRRAIDVLRSDGRRWGRELHAPFAYESFPDATRTDAMLERAHMSGSLHLAIGRLPEAQREAVERLVIEEKSLAEAAAVTGRREGALKVNLHRALKTLRATLRGE